MPSLQLIREITVTDKSDKVVYHKREKAHSFVLQFLQLLQCLFDGRSDISAQDVTDTTETIMTAASTTPNKLFHIDNVDNNASYGIVVGTGETAPANTDPALETQIAHGVGATQLNYGGHSFTDAQVVGANVDMIVSRTFQNASGSSITVKEAGIYAKTYNATPAVKYFCIIHDLTGDIVVTNGQTLTITYTLRTTV